MSDDSFGKEIFPNTQSEPALTQLEAINQPSHFCLFHVMLLFCCINKPVLNSSYQPI